MPGNKLMKCKLVLLFLLLPLVGFAQHDLSDKPLKQIEPGTHMTDIILGMSGAFSGTSAKLGSALHNGMSVYFEHINAQGGINGRLIHLRIYDDGYDPEPAIKNTLKLIEEDEVTALIGYIGTPTVTRVLPLLNIYNNKNILLFFPFTGAEPQRQPPFNEYVYNLRPSYRQETKGLVDHLVNIGRDRIAVFYQADAYGRSGWDGVRRALKAQALNIVGEATYRRGTPYDESFVQQVEILRGSRPDVIISIGAYAAAAGFIRDSRNAGWDVPIANVSFVDSESLLELLVAESVSNGTDYTANLINSEVVPNYRDDSYPAVLEYRRLMQESDLEELGFVSFEGYLNAKLMVEILRRTGGDINRTAIKNTMNTLVDLDIGIDEYVHFGETNNQGLQTVYFNTVQDGHYVSIDDWSVWDFRVPTL